MASPSRSNFVGGRFLGGWLRYEPSLTGKSIDEFVSYNKPSKISRSPGVQWIFVKNPAAETEHCGDTCALVEAWEELQLSGKPINSESLSVLAAQHNFTVGKWMLFPSLANVDDLWRKIAKATHAGNLGISAKVSSSKPGSGQHVICIYTHNYLDEADVNSVLQSLRGLGVKGMVNYKPDIYTILGIYARNPWKIKASVYTSKE